MFHFFQVPAIAGMLNPHLEEREKSDADKDGLFPHFQVIIPELPCWYKIEELCCGKRGEAGVIKATRYGHNTVHLR